jgi:hypothetical protein
MNFMLIGIDKDKKEIDFMNNSIDRVLESTAMQYAFNS